MDGLLCVRSSGRRHSDRRGGCHLNSAKIHPVDDDKHAQRGLLLLQQQRWELALVEFSTALEDQPQDALILSYHALCLLHLERLSEAEEQVRQAVGQDPELAYAHYVLSLVLHERGDVPKALQAVQTAIQLEPEEAQFWGFAAALLCDLKRWKEAQETAEQGLAMDPNNSVCANMRARALMALGHPSQAQSHLGNLLQEDPEDALTHSGLGWVALEQGRRQDALEHFHESLRLDPESDWARAGLLEALKLRYPFYGFFLGAMLRLARLSGRWQGAIIIGGYLAYRALRDVARAGGPYSWVAMPLVAAYLVFAYLSWTARPLTNFLLMLTRYGRQLLDSRERREVALICPLWLIAALGALWEWKAPHQGGTLLAMLGLLQPIMIAATFSCSEGWPRKLMGGLAVTSTLLAVLGLVCALLGDKFALVCMRLWTWLWLASIIAANFLTSARVRR